MSSFSRRFLILVPTLAAISYIASSEVGAQALRRLATNCIRNVFASPNDIVEKMPEVPPSTTEDIPAYIALCQEWIRHEAYYQDGLYESQRIVEDVDVCMDWSAPHYSLMDIFAGLIISAHVPRIKYRHNCHRTKTYHEALTGFDHTTIQQVLNSPGLRSNDNVVPVAELKLQCKRCLLSFDGQVEASRIKSKAFHHCFAWPEDEKKQRSQDVATIPYVPFNFPGVAPFSSIIIAFRQRLYHSALEWQDVSGFPPNARDSGVAYWIDPTTIGLKYEDVAAEMPDNITTISILASPLCATAILPTGEHCYEYGEGLREYLKKRFRHLDASHGVTFKIMTSTAAAYSRMILSQWLICPPRSNSCLFPAAAKRYGLNKAIVLEDPAWMKAVDFMRIAGHHGTTTTKILSADKIPPVYTLNPDRRLQASDLTMINAIVDSEGYPEDITRPPMESDETINSLTPQQILDDVSIAIERFKTNPNLLFIREENVPTMEDVQKALAAGEPLRTNQVILWDNPHAFMPAYRDPRDDRYFRYAELATDSDSGRVGPQPTVEYYQDSTTRRHESMLRMQQEWEVSVHLHLQNDRSNYDDPTTIFEVKCPEGSQPDGSTIEYKDDGTIMTRTEANTILLITKDGVELFEPVDGNHTAAEVPAGSVVRQGDGYAIQDEISDSDSPANRRVVEIDMTSMDLKFRAEIQKVCEKYGQKIILNSEASAASS